MTAQGIAQLAAYLEGMGCRVLAVATAWLSVPGALLMAFCFPFFLPDRREAWRGVPVILGCALVVSVTARGLAVPVAPPVMPAIDCKTVLSELDLTQKLAKKAYESELAKYQARLSELVRDPRFVEKHSLVLVFEGADAAGKGGSIRRVAGAMDARHYQIIPIAAPTDEERAQPYLWRFWRHVPHTGRVALFDRSWYGRVLVERVEGFCSEADWLRAYAEINDFEHQLAQAGTVVIKFWLQISADEQLHRFKAREEIDFKRFKITDEDWRNRERWDDYAAAACDMVDRTSTGLAPWTLVEANDKNFARAKVLRTICERLENTLEGDKGKHKQK